MQNYFGPPEENNDGSAGILFSLYRKNPTLPRGGKTTTDDVKFKLGVCPEITNYLNLFTKNMQGGKIVSDDYYNLVISL